MISVSCNDKLELNAPYKEIPSVYAVLNPQEQKQVIRVNKVFLGEGDANQMAKVADSVNYQPGEITVSLTRSYYQTKDVTPDAPGLETLVFEEEVIQTSPGAFNTTQRVYTTTKKLFPFGDYTLRIKNNKTGNVFTATTAALDSVRITGLQPFSGPYYPIMPGTLPSFEKTNYIDYSEPAYLYKLPYKPNNAKIYMLRIRVHFYDSVAGSPNNTFHSVDYDFSNQYGDKAYTAAPFAGFLVAEMRGSDYFSAVGNALSKANLKDPTTIWGRKAFKVQFFIYSSSQEYMDYLQHAAPSLNISQSKPIYSNFDEKKALGLFTFRTRFTIMKDIHPYFINAFALNANTRPYGFLLSNCKRP